MSNEIIRLDEEDVGSLITKAKAYGMRADTRFRGWMLAVVAILFLCLNAAVMGLVYWAFAQDITNLAMKPPLPRLVTDKVLMSLIGATVVQTGIGFVTVMSYLFPKGNGQG